MMRYLASMEDIIKILLLYICFTLNKATETVELQTCPGEQKMLLCSANYTLLEWGVLTFNQMLRQSETRSVPYLGQNPTISPILANSANFTFSRDSSSGALPLVSTMIIKNVTSNLEGTVVNCTGINSSSISSVVLVKTIHIIDVNIDIPHSPDVVVRTDMIHFGNDNFMVTLEWSQFSDETYTVVTDPEAIHIRFTTNTSVQLVMLYNTKYDVNVTAVTLTVCGHRNATNFTMIHYAHCDFLLINTMISTDPITIISGTVPALQGQNITFSCFGNESLSICGEGGKWDPDPEMVCQATLTEVTNLNPQSTITAGMTPVSNMRVQTRTASSSLLGSLVGVSFFLIISLISVIVAALVILKRRGSQTLKQTIKIKDTHLSENPRKIQSLTATQESKTVHEMVHSGTDQLGTLIYADVFSSSMIPSEIHNQVPKLEDDKVDYAEVSHNSIMSPNNNSEIDFLLNLDNLLIQIKQDATQMWYQLGRAFGIEKKVLEKYSVCSPEESIIEMLDYWLRSHSGQPTWKEVAEALRKIHLHESAQEIEMIYKTGELSVAVDTDLNQIPQELITHDQESPPPLPPKGFLK